MVEPKKIRLYTEKIRDTFETLFTFASTTQWTLSYKWISKNVVAVYEIDTTLGHKIDVLPLILHFYRCYQIGFLSHLFHEGPLDLVKCYCEMVLDKIKSATPPSKRIQSRRKRMIFPLPELNPIVEEEETYYHML